MPRTNSRQQQLRSAEESAATRSNTAPPDRVCLPCERGDARALEVLVVGEDDQPLLDVRLELRLGPDRLMRARSNREGRVRFEGLEDGASYTLGLPDLDHEAWEPVADEALPQERAGSQLQAEWSKAPASPEREPPPTVHVVDQGDCLGSIASQYGFHPETLWKWSGNASLRKKRAERHVLLPDDEVHLPPPRDRREEVRAGRRYRVRRKGVPDMLRLRFLDCDEEPRVGLPFLLRLQTFSGESVKETRGELDADGYVKAPIPPDADLGELILGTGPDRETYQLELGRVDPLESFSGLQDRLANLGYYGCCDEDREHHQVTRWALERLQLAHDVEPTEQPDDPTRELLKTLHLS